MRCNIWKVQVSFVSSFSYDCLGICPQAFVLVCFYRATDVSKAHEQVMSRFFRIVVSVIVLLRYAEQDHNCSSAVMTRYEMFKQLLLLRKSLLPFARKQFHQYRENVWRNEEIRANSNH